MTIKTDPRITFGVGYSLVVKDDSAPSIGNLQPFSKSSDLRTDSTTNRPYATYEPDFWLLDGEYKFMPPNLNAVHVGIMNLTVSAGTSDFGSPPQLSIPFGQVHDIEAFTMRFSEYSNDFVDSMRVEFFDIDDVQIGSDYNVTPTTWEFQLTLADKVLAVKRINITFYSTNKPYRFLRVTAIDYGRSMLFTGDKIKEARVVEETDPTSLEVRCNSFECVIYSSDALFSPINPGGDYYSLTQRQPISVSEQIGLESMFIGQYYLDKWSNISDTQIKFECIDLLSILDTSTYMGGIWIGAGILIEDLLQDIFDPIHIPWDLDAGLYGATIKGWLPICTYREALQQIAFAIGAYVDTSRDRPIKIYPIKIAEDGGDYDLVVTKAMKGIDQEISLRPIITGVEVVGHNIFYGSGILKLYDDTLAIGDHEIRFKQPCHSLQITGATISSYGANHAILHVTSPGAVTLTGLVYTDTRKIFSVRAIDLAPSVIQNILQIDEASLVNSSNAQTVAQRIYDYFQQRLIQNMKMFAVDIHSADTILIDTLHGQQIRGEIEKITIDLANGMIEDVEIVGIAETAPIGVD